jgi:serine/threonine protein kinase/DNA-binding beta-propeller fold protein YncE
MSASQDEDRRLEWLEALHEAVVAGQDDAFSRSASRASQGEEFDALRACLQRLENARRGGNWGIRPPDAEFPADSSVPQRIGKFDILRRLGGGGQGIVFLAFDTELRRQVALKIPRPDALASADARRRFLREAHAAAGLSHPRIVAVHEIADAFPACYLVSDYCPGGSLQQYLQEHRRQIVPRAAAEFVTELAAGVHYAHARGVLHRDIKPSNVFLVSRLPDQPERTVVDPLQDFTPKLGDFGLAQLVESDGERTATGVVLGTPAYMSPEQARGRISEIGPPTDVYGLGMVLYEMLAGRPTFRGVSDADTLRQVLFVEPEPLRRVNPQVPRDLEAVCQRAIEKDSQRRYSSAAALADDLQRYLDGRPTLVRPLTPIGKLWRAACRRPGVATLTSLLCAALLVAVVLFVTSAIEQRRLNTQLVKHVRESTDLAYAADMQLADQAWHKNDITSLESILNRYIPRPGEYDPRGVEWRYLQTRLQASSRILLDQNGPGGCVRFSPDRRWLAAGSHDGRIRVWKMPGASLEWAAREEPPQEINAFAFSPDGKILAAASNANRVLLYELATGKLLRSLEGGHNEWVADVDFSPDGEQLCSVSGDGTIALWNWKTGQPLKQFRGHTQELRSARFTRDGQHVITGAQKGIVQIWSLTSQQPVASVVVEQKDLQGTAIWPRDIELSADRSQMAVCWDEGGLMVYDLADLSQPALIHSLPQETCNQVAFLSNTRLAVASAYGTGHIWTLGNSTPDRTLRGHRDKIVSISATLDDGRVATASIDGSVRLWPADLDDGSQTIIEVEGNCDDLKLSPTAQEIALELAEPSRLAVVRLDTREVQTKHSGLTGAPRAVAYLAGGLQLAVAGEESVLIYERPSGVLVWRWTPPTQSPASKAFEELRSAGKFLVVKGAHGISVLDLTKQALAWQRQFNEGLWGVAVSPDDQLVYVGDQLGKIRALRISDGSTAQTLQGPVSPVNDIAISSSGRLLLSAARNREIGLWDRVPGTAVRRFASDEDVLGFPHFTFDEKTVIARHNQFHLGFWHVSSGQRLMTTGPWGDRVLRWDLSPDGRKAYLAVQHAGRTSVRMLALDPQAPAHATAAQSDPVHPD